MKKDFVLAMSLGLALALATGPWYAASAQALPAGVAPPTPTMPTSAPPAPAVPAPAPTLPTTSPPGVAADQPATTARGTTFTVPRDWRFHAAGGVDELTSPEGDLHLVVLDIGPAADARAALAAAWARYAPGVAREPKTVTPQVARDGWDQRATADYETSPNERRVIAALARRRGADWTVLLIDGPEATYEKRAAGARLVDASLRPAGYVRESFAGRPARPLTPARITELKAFVVQSMRELGIPGAAFALTDRDRTVYATGLGVRELGRRAPVDAETRFMIASNTKGLSTLLLARLVDRAKLRWDEPVTEAYPGFRLGSPETTRRVEVRHLVCACTGLPRKDMEWVFNTPPTTPASSAFAQLAATEPTSGFGEVFQYNNLMASAAGYIGGHLVYPGLELGRAYDQAMDEEIFRPLGMRHTGFDTAAVRRQGNWARPHALDADGRLRASVTEGMRFDTAVAPYRPAGGAWSNAADLIRYVRFELREGRLDDGRQWVSRAALLERRKPGVPVGEDHFYGMGLETDRSTGVEVIHHGGSLGGYKSDILLVPEAGIGAVILTNSDEGQLLLAPFRRRLLELLYDGQPEAVATVAASAESEQTQYLAERSRLTVPADPRAVAELAPAYASPELGRLVVTRDGPTPVFHFVTLSSPMATRRNDDGTTSFVTLEPIFEGFPLVVASDHGQRQLIVRDAQHEYRFTETP